MKNRIHLAVVAAILLAPGLVASTPPGIRKFEVENAEIHQTLRDLAKAFHANIAAQPKITGSVTGSFVNCSLDEILSELLPQVGASHCVSGKIVIVGEPGLRGCGPVAALRLPFVGPPIAIERVPPSIIVGSQPESARPDQAPYFGRQEAGMPNTHFMDPRIPIAEPSTLPR